MANIFATSDLVAKRALSQFYNNLQLAKTAKKQYQPEYMGSYKTGDTIRIKQPVNFVVGTGASVTPQDLIQNTTTLTIAWQDNVAIDLKDQESVLDLESFDEQILQPAMRNLANKVDQRLYDTTIDIANAVGQPGTAPNSLPIVNSARATLDSFGVDPAYRYAMFETFDAASVQDALYNTFNENFNKDIILKGSMGNLVGFDFYSTQNPIRPEYGSLPIASIGTPLVDGAAQTGSSLVTDGWTASTVNILYQGATFTIDGVFSVNPVGLQSTGRLQTFTVISNPGVDSDAGGVATIDIYPAITTSGPYQTVSNSPADNAAITVNETHRINVAYQQEAFTLAMIPLPEENDGVFQKTVSDPRSGISLRMTKQYQGYDDVRLIRFDVFYGVKCFPRYACRVMGS